MASTLPSANTCCDPCETPESVAVPGPEGPAGADGTNGTDGENAYTTATVAFVMPDGTGGSPDVSVTVGNSDWAAVNAVVFAGAGALQGWFRVISKASSAEMTIRNLEDGSGAYASNSAPGSTFPIGTIIAGAGLQGPAGASVTGAPVDATYITQTPNGTLTNEQSLSGLATGMVKVTTGTGALSTGTLGTDYYGPSMTADVPVTEGGTGASTAANARTNLGLVIGTNVQAQDATLQSLSALGTAADRMAYTTGVDTWAEAILTSFARNLLDDASAAAARATLGVIAGVGDYLLFRHQETSGTGGGAFTTGAWRIVPLNTEVADTGNNGSIASNQITLLAGTYRYEFQLIFVSTDAAQGRLFDVTNSAVITNSYGSVNFTGAAFGSGRFTLNTTTTIRLEGQIGAAGGTFGDAMSFGGGEVYSWITLTKE